MSAVDDARRDVDRATAMYGWSSLADATLAMAKALDALIAAVRAEQREECAAIADGLAYSDATPQFIAARIRAGKP